MIARLIRGLSRPVTASGIRVYCYHGVVEQIAHPRLERYMTRLSDFQDHARFLSRFHVVTLAEALEILKSPGRESRPLALITFDDGYENNLVACEILAELKLPAAVFITTGSLGEGGLLWTVELALLIL